MVLKWEICSMFTSSIHIVVDNKGSSFQMCHFILHVMMWCDAVCSEIHKWNGFIDKISAYNVCEMSYEFGFRTFQVDYPLVRWIEQIENAFICLLLSIRFFLFFFFFFSTWIDCAAHSVDLLEKTNAYFPQLQKRSAYMCVGESIWININTHVRIPLDHRELFFGS